MIVISVQAKSASVSIYVLAKYSSVPIADVGVQSTSAATPAFHAIPSDDLQAARKYGNTVGIYSLVSFVRGENLYTLVTSKSSFEAIREARL